MLALVIFILFFLFCALVTGSLVECDTFLSAYSWYICTVILDIARLGEFDYLGD